MAVPATPHYRKALDQGDTLGPRLRPHVHWARPTVDRWLDSTRTAGWRIVVVELPDDAVPLTRLPPARLPSVVLLGHEHTGIPAHCVAQAGERIQIPMVGVGASLNVAVAGSLVLYRLAGLSWGRFETSHETETELERTTGFRLVVERSTTSVHCGVARYRRAPGVRRSRLHLHRSWMVLADLPGSAAGPPTR